MSHRESRLQEAVRLAREAQYWAKRYREASERVEEATNGIIALIEEGNADADDRVETATDRVLEIIEQEQQGDDGDA